MDALALHEAMDAADRFFRIARHSLDRPQPERVEEARVKLIEALARLAPASPAP